MTTFYSKFRIGDAADTFCNVHSVNQKEPLNNSKKKFLRKTRPESGQKHNFNDIVQYNIQYKLFRCILEFLVVSPVAKITC